MVVVAITRPWNTRAGGSVEKTAIQLAYPTPTVGLTVTLYKSVPALFWLIKSSMISMLLMVRLKRAFFGCVPERAKHLRHHTSIPALHTDRGPHWL